MMLLPMITAAFAGILLLLSSFSDHLAEKKKEDHVQAWTSGEVHVYVGIFMLLSAIMALMTAWGSSDTQVLFLLMDRIPVAFRVDDISRLFLTVTTIVWVAVCFYSFRYMEQEGEEKRFYGFFLLVYAVLTGLDLSGNLISFYFFYELMTLTSMPLVLHHGTREAIMAAYKYLFYSMAGAYFALFGIFFLYRYCNSLSFQAGGTLNMALASSNSGILLIAVFSMLVGFGAKAGMFPLHAWLPTAHPVAPAPASAALSAIIVKSGILAVVRTVYYIVGPDFLRGTWVQYAWMILALITVFMGSLLSFREKVFKKRLAYSTVSQVSYILFGLALMSPQAFSGAMLQFTGHAFVKCALFMTAGIFILRTGKTRVEEYRGIGKGMEITLWGYTLAALALIGIPPTVGFVSKWYLAEGALEAGVGVFSYIGPVVLLVSALLTAGYLLPITTNGFFPGGNADPGQKSKGAHGDARSLRGERIDLMTAMLLILAALAVLIGVAPGRLLEFFGSIASDIL